MTSKEFFSYLEKESFLSDKEFLKNPGGLATVVLLFLGTSIRLFHFYQNRCLEGDELSLALNFTDRTFTELTKPLSNDQHAPFGFLASVKFFTSFFGIEEPALRLMPLLSGIASIFVFSLLTKKLFSPWIAFAALACFCFNRDLIFYSVTLKQYQTEVLVTVLLCLAYIRFKDSLRPVHLLAWACIGAVSVWFSYSSVFILAATGITAAYGYIRQKNHSKLFHLIPVFTFWAISFALVYFLFVQSSTSSNWLVKFWNDKNAFAPPPTSANNISWYVTALMKMVSSPLSLKPSIHASVDYKLNLLVGLCMLIGGAFVWTRKPHLFSIFFLPFLFTLTASFFQHYPFSGRLLLFLVPLCLLLIFTAIENVLLLTNQKLRNPIPVKIFIWVFVSLFVFYPTVTNSIDSSIYRSSGAREALNLINKQRHEGDPVYVHAFLSTAHAYYQKIYGYKWQPSNSGSPYGHAATIEDYQNTFEKDFEKLHDQDNLWLLTNKKILVALAPSDANTFVDRLQITEESMIIKVLLKDNGFTVKRSGDFYAESVFLRTKKPTAIHNRGYGW